jgi:hypothetical protein
MLQSIGYVLFYVTTLAFGLVGCNIIWSLLFDDDEPRGLSRIEQEMDWGEGGDQ